MTVWLLMEETVYEGDAINGVYASLESAKAAAVAKGIEVNPEEANVMMLERIRFLPLVALLVALVAGCMGGDECRGVAGVNYDAIWSGHWEASTQEPRQDSPCAAAPRPTSMDMGDRAELLAAMRTSPGGGMVLERTGDECGVTLAGGGVVEGWTLQEARLEVCGRSLCGLVAWERDGDRCEWLTVWDRIPE